MSNANKYYPVLTWPQANNIFAPLGDYYTGLVTTIVSTNAVTTAGNWYIAGVHYSKGTTTTTALEAQDATLFREDILYATTSNTILKAVGVLGADYTAPSIPDNTIAIADIFISPTGTSVTPSTKTPVYTTGNQTINGHKTSKGQTTFDNLVFFDKSPFIRPGNLPHFSLKGDTVVQDTTIYASLDYVNHHSGGSIPTNGLQVISPDSIGQGGDFNQPTTTFHLIGSNTLFYYSDQGDTFQLGANGFFYDSFDPEIGQGGLNMQPGNAHLYILDTLGREQGISITNTNGMVIKDVLFSNGLYDFAHHNYIGGTQLVEGQDIDSLATARGWGSSSFTFTGGLTNSGGVVTLGGTLTGTQTINITGTNELAINGNNATYYSQSNYSPDNISFTTADNASDNIYSVGVIANTTFGPQATIGFSDYNTSLESVLRITNSAMTINDSQEQKGLLNAGDYEANFVARSLVTKQYVDAAVAGGGGGTTTHPLTINNSGTGVSSGGTFDGSSAVTISYNSIGAQAAGSYAVLNASNTFTGGFTSQYNGGSTYPFTSINNVAVTNTTASGTAVTLQSNALSWVTGGFVGSLVMTPTANRTITLPDATTTLLGTNNIKTVNSQSLVGSGNVAITTTNTDTTATGFAPKSFVLNYTPQTRTVAGQPLNANVLTETYLGTIYNPTTFSSLSAFDSPTATVSASGGVLNFSGGTNDFSKRLVYTYYSALDLWSWSGTFTAPSTVNSTSYGFGLAYGNNPINLQLDCTNTGTAGQLRIYINSTVIATSATNLTFSASDIIVLTLVKNANTYTGTVYDQTTKSAVITLTYVFPTSIVGGNQMPNTGEFAITSYGGSFTCTALTLSSNAVKNSIAMIGGDSKIAGYASTTPGYRIVNLVGQALGNVTLHGSQGDLTSQEILCLPEIIALHPKVYYRNTGSNDIRGGRTVSATMANIATITTTLQAAGIQVIQLLPFAENTSLSGVDLGPLASAIESAYPTSYIDTYNTPLQITPSALYTDGIHLTNYGNQIIANIIIQNALNIPSKFIGYNIGQNFDLDHVLNAGNTSTLTANVGNIVAPLGTINYLNIPNGSNTTGALNIGANLNSNSYTVNTLKLGGITYPTYAAAGTGTNNVLIWGQSFNGSFSNVYVGGGGIGYAATDVYLETNGSPGNSGGNVGLHINGNSRALFGNGLSDNGNDQVQVKGSIISGVAGSVQGSLKVAGSTSGTITIQPQAAAGTYNFNLPITAGTAGQVLTSQGGSTSAMTWGSYIPTSTGRIGQTALTAGVATITISGLTTSSNAFVSFVSTGGTVSTTWQYKAVCTANTLTITAITNTGSVDTTDSSTLNYEVIN